MSDVVEYYMMDFGTLPDELYKPEVPLVEWQKHLKTAGADGFKQGELATVASISPLAWMERVITYPIYMIMNAAPFTLPPLLWALFGYKGCLMFVVGLFGIHLLLEKLNPMGNAKKGQYIYTERNIQKYNSIKWVWPKSLQPPELTCPKIYCAIPHGLAPVGIVAYPGWSKLFGERLNHPTAAPVVLKLPIISYFLRKIGYIPAESKSIKKCLAKEENVSLVLDGIAGMFQKDRKQEIGWVKERKGIVKIALTTGTPLVPCFAFGTSELWRILTDPLGVLEKISIKMNVSVTPFCGRPFGLMPFGPPYRTPITVAFGEPIKCPKTEDPTQAQIEEYHQKFMDSLMQAFETHKVSYGWSHKALKLV